MENSYNKYIGDRINKAMNNLVKEFLEDLDLIRCTSLSIALTPKIIDVIKKWEKRSEKE